jgi:hypothetical protein
LQCAWPSGAYPPRDDQSGKRKCGEQGGCNARTESNGESPDRTAAHEEQDSEAAKETLSAPDISPTTLRNTKDTAIRAMSVFPDEAALNDARHTVGLAVYELILAS